ncbi:MAG: pyridoxal-phosphate dependent enzyme, partial [Candidatus Omnitrophota bacterium]
FEICDFLQNAPTFHAIPVGNAGNITAYWKGYKEYDQKKKTGLPRMLGFQAAKSAPIVDGHIIEKPETLATAIRIGNPASWKTAEAARDESKGLIDKVTDEEILQAYKLLAQKEGVFAEPASAASVAGILKLHKNNFFQGQKGNIVCTLTGHGLKDPNLVIQNIAKPVTVDPDLKSILKEIGL